jgi:surface carbohydrate biosynthesis protein (TIGR04326 family)
VTEDALPEYSELWICFEAPAEPLPSQALALSFLRADDDEIMEQRWGPQYMSGRILAQEVRKDARRHYLDLIARVGATPVQGQTFRQALQGKGGYSRWWFLKTSEKDCVWDGDVTYTTIIRLLCVKRVADKHGIKHVRLVGGSREFAGALATFFDLASGGHEARRASGVPPAELLRVMGIGLLSRLACTVFYLRLWWLLGRMAPRAPEDIDVLFQAHVDWSLARGPDGRLQDRYFTDLPGMLEAKGIKVGWLAWCEPDSNIRHRRLRNVVATILPHRSVILLEQYLHPRDIVLLIWNTSYLTEFLRFSRVRAFRDLFRVEGFDLFPLLRSQMLPLFSGSSVCRWELLALASERVCRSLRPNVLLTFLELFLHARAIYAGARCGAPTVKLWAAQHASYSSDKTFGFVRPDLELQGQPDGCAIPAPDGIFAMGDLARRLWLEAGFSGDRVPVTGGLRYQTVQVERRPKSVECRPATILLIGGMNEALDIDMCAAVRSAARNLPFRMRLRDHPHYRVSERQSFLPFREVFEISAGTAEEDLQGADLVLFTHSGMAEEAFLKGIPTWQWLWAGFNSSVFVDLHVIPSFTSIPELRRALQGFLTDPDRYRPQREAQELVMRQCFGPDPARTSEHICAKILDLVGAPVVPGTLQSRGVA